MPVRTLAEGAWCWFADPRALHVNGSFRRTYVGWLDRQGGVRVRSHDHDTGAAASALLHAHLQVDDHANPALLFRPDRHLLVFYSAHNGHRMLYRRSARPEDVTDWGPEQTIPTNTPGTQGYTYPNPVQLGAEADRIYLFWRGGDWNPAFATHDAGPAAWSPARNFIRAPGQRPYVKVVSDGHATIHFAFTDGHPRNVLTGIFHAFYRDGAFYRSDGTAIADLARLPFTPAQATHVYDPHASGVRAWVHDVALDATGAPLIVYADLHSAQDHRYVYARWNGDHWVRHPVVRAGGTIAGDGREGYYSGGITFDHENPATVWLSREISGVHEVERWQTPDGGATWSHEAITSHSPVPNVRPIATRGPHGGALDLVWMRGSYPNYTHYQTSIVTRG